MPQTRASGRGLGVQYQQTAVVSPAYYAFHCGSFINSQFMVHSNWGLMGIYQISKGYTFSCYYSSAYQD